jgi:hypothetical protein
MRIHAAGLAMAGLLGLAMPASAEVARFELTGPPQPVLEGREFGVAGRYERVSARATVAVDPADPRNAVIADIAAAPRNAQGRVEAVADVTIMRPSDPARGNGTLLLEVPNRGRKLALPLFNESPTAADLQEAGNGFLFRQGYTMVWVGWQSDFTPAAGQLGIRVPVLAGVTGAVREEVVFDHMRSPAAIPLAYAAVEPADARVTVRARWDLPRETPADLSFRFADPRRVEVTRPAGFDAGALYELTYTARDPMVLGLGFAAVRDVASFLRHGRGADNPLAGQVRRSLGFGISQSGRFLRDYLYLGFNEDTEGRPVFDGLMPHVAGTRRMFMNSRFARPDKAPRHPQDPAWPADAFPFTYADTANPFTGERDGLLRRCRLSSTCPKVMQTDTEYEWWGAHASLLVTDPLGGHLDLPPEVRAYMVAGTPHFAEPGAQSARNPICALPTNPNHAGAPMRALLGHLDAWMRGEAAPPASRVPDRASGTLVEAERALPVAIPGLPFTGLHVPAAQSDHGTVPPRELGRFAVLVPRADADGMAIAGVRLPVLEAPRATYTAWNPRAEGHGPGVMCPLQGAVMPLAPTRAEREATGDPRPSLEERYPTPAAYAEAVRAAADRLVAERLLLAEDAAAMTAAAEAGRLAR